MNNDILKCSHCNKTFKIKNCENIYRCGDTYVCSHMCSQKRYRELRNIDPGFSQPHTWTLVKSTSTRSLFNPEPQPTKKEPARNLDKSTIKKETCYFDIIYESDDATPVVIENKNTERARELADCNEVLSNRFRTLCNRCFVLGIPSLCAICIIITTTV